ncbi:MAG: hypothetical protein VX438_06805 [Planctomycetota bacterium]|nr:hypothetical protein [Planctomycetota bacterium]
MSKLLHELPNLKSPEEEIEQHVNPELPEGEKVLDPVFNDMEPTKKRRKPKHRKLYCRCCWRIERQSALNQDLKSILLFTVVTCGLYLLFRRYQCRICGHPRLGIGE